MRAFILSVAASVLLSPMVPLSAHTAEIKNNEAACAQTACREGGYTLLVVSESQPDGAILFHSVTVPGSPYVFDDGSLLIVPGETLLYSLKTEGSVVKATFLKRYHPEYPHIQPEGSFKDWSNPADEGLPKLVYKEEGTPSLEPDQLLISYGQPYGNEGKPDVFLVMRHSFKGTLKPKAIMGVFDDGAVRYVPTSTCPMRKNIVLYEHWPHPIGVMIINSLTLLADDAPHICE